MSIKLYLLSQKALKCNTGDAYISLQYQLKNIKNTLTQFFL